MAEERKKIVCGLCSPHCRYDAIIKDGEFIGPDVEQKTESIQEEIVRHGVAACPRAHAAKELIYHPDRLNYPLKRKGNRGDGQWEQISWQQALDEIADKISSIRDEYGPEALAIQSSGEQNIADEFRIRFSNLFGTPNYLGPPSCGVGMVLSHMMCGAMMYIPYVEMETRCIMMLGTNLDSSVPHAWRGIRDMCKLLGTKLIVVDPNETPPAKEADIWLRPKVGTDAALLLGMIKVIIDEGLWDKEFVEKWCHGFDKLVERVKDYPIEKVASITGVPAEKIQDAARTYATNKPALTFHITGLEEQPNCTQALHARYILPAITGNIDVKGGDVMLAPHPTARVVADMDMHEMLSPEQQDKMIDAARFPLYSWRAFRIVEENIKKMTDRPAASMWTAGFGHAATTFRAMIDGKPYPVKGLLTVAKSPLHTFPNARLIYEAIMKLDLHVAMDIFMTPACRIADYVLPAACCFEKPIIHGGDYYPYLHGGEAAIEPLYERKPEFYLWRELGLRLGQEQYWPWKTIEEHYDWRLEPLGMTFKEFIAGEGHDTPPFPYKKYEANGFGTPTGKFEIYCTILEELGYDPLPSYQSPDDRLRVTAETKQEYPLTLLSGGRNRRFYHSQGRHLQSLRKKSPEPIAQLNPETGSQLGIASGDWMWIETPVGKARFKCQHSVDIDPEAVQAEHGWWFPEDPSTESLFVSNVSVLLDDDPDLCDPPSGNYPVRGQLCRAYQA